MVNFKKPGFSFRKKKEEPAPAANGEAKPEGEAGTISEGEALGDSAANGQANGESAPNGAAPAGDAPAAEGAEGAEGAGAEAGADKKKKEKKEDDAPKKKAEKYTAPEDRIRTWELNVSIRSFDNVTTEKLNLFFSVSLNSEFPKKHYPRVRILPKYTGMYTLAKGESEVPDNPIILYERKWFRLSYKELTKHVVKVDMWKVSSLTFNNYFGHVEKKLYDVANKPAAMDLMLKKKLTKAQMNAKKKIKPADVAVFCCNINLEELFDFQLKFDNWTFIADKNHPKFSELSTQRKRLKFIIPKNRKANAVKSQACSTSLVPWTEDKERYFWASPGKFIFTGTRTHLQNSYFCVAVYNGMPPDGLVKASNGKCPWPAKLIGRALMGLISVLDISVFKGVVKALTNIRKQFYVGVLNGNIKAVECSKGMKEEETDVKQRPEQPKGATSVSHLNPKERFLVVRINKCESLAVADVDSGSSDPYLRVSWDGMVQFSPIIKTTVRPVFNMTFFFPVRLCYARMEKKDYQKEALVYELQSKGPVVIQVWDDDETSSDFLGGYEMTLFDVLITKNRQIRTLLGSVKPKGEIDEDAPVKIPPWYLTEKTTRIFDGMKTPLKGSPLPNNAAALIHFEAYFYPDWMETLKLASTDDEEGGEKVWIRRRTAFDNDNDKFSQLYLDAFPDSIGGRPIRDDPTSGKAPRRFISTCLHPQRRDTMPLMSFLCPIIIPEELSFPSMLVHWVKTISFHISPRQHRLGRIPDDGFKNPSFLLATRKGPPQDHAVMLCCLLLGCKKDAYVCKGTVVKREYDPKHPNKDPKETLIEHSWVMTREKGGTVTFWETCNRRMYHLPKRWSGKEDDKKGKKKGKTGSSRDKKGKGASAEEEEEEDEDADKNDEEWEGEVPDAQLGTEDLEMLPSVGRAPRAKAKVSDKKKKDREDRDKMKKEMLKRREGLLIAPNKSLLKEDTLVTDIPYDSIDIVFNRDNVWGNRQNHHPACMTYDMQKESVEKPEDWDGDEHGPRWKRYKNKQELEDVEYIDMDVVVPPMLKPPVIDALKEALLSEMRENMRMYRAKRGYDTSFDDRDDLIAMLSKFLDMQEMRLSLDPDFCPAEDREFLKVSDADHNKHDSPFSADGTYVSTQKGGWAELKAAKKAFEKKIDDFPTKRGKVFAGFPVHFSTADDGLIRTYLMEIEQYRSMLNVESDDVTYSIDCKITPLLGGIQSVWLYIGSQQPKETSDA
eukprot:gnl/MRDRNA2_/MRDRNA2_100357_c0_seq1.p1 gnl/MRDRNA2_/MRDRNA2_100357_c0~~gnl/MRDRNA2_/MRDRNA2_100357_c0_seq1.p1  ORF type:complete len:1229 (+),score=291.58 gnl/MRDRNA2_/MRDRNA2_100357_c0_seq1:146-3832(+)